jgi:ABC-type transporter Mla MlaB component
MKSGNDATNNKIELGENLTIQNLSELIVSVRRVFDMEGQINIDASKLERVDGAGLQLLCMLFKEAYKQHLTLAWVNATEPLCMAADIMGVTDHLQLTLHVSSIN